MRYSSRFFLYGPFVGLLILAALATTHWWTVASAWRERLDRANGHEIAPGMRMNFSQKRLAGFPFRLDVTLKNLRIELAEANGPVIWTAEEFAAHALSYGRTQMILESAGKQTFSWTDAREATHRFAFLPGTFRASAILERGKLVRFDSEIVDLDGNDFRARNAQLHFRSLQNALDLYLKLEGAHLTSGYGAALGPELTSLLVRGHMARGNIFEPMLTGKEAPQTAFDRWHDSGGQLIVNELSIVKGQSTFKFSGALAMDDAHDLSGVLQAKSGNDLVFSGDRLYLQSGLPRP